ncbi:HAD family hydrolase [Pseudomonas sp.]|uniref:HAD family hydrolase n=1 Tax=Pseudomonas sp. TaxID=306 RepID=UPI002CD84CE6|nr:HAD family hydrolase [Pseudomonas sp.]HUE92476.1 HAD family hydrolase [Pseudomonas sp.]
MERYQLLLEEFDRILPAVRAVSFDVFDTLLVRVLHEPENLFDLMGHQLADRGFAEQRKIAQAHGFKQMAREGRKELTLADIYDNLSHAQHDSAVLAELEQKLEHAVIRLNPEVVAMFDEARNQGKVVVLTSDMYLPQTFFEQLAERLELSVDHLLVSSACDCTKRDKGELFDLLKQRLGLAGEQILHIGDNPLGDVQRAKEKGLHTLHYRPPAYAAQVLFDALPAVATSAYLCAGLARYACYQDSKNPWYRLGWQYGGPLLHGFLDWIQNEVRDEGIDRLLFISRDGFLLHQLHQQHSVGAVEARYMRGSRVAFTMAALSEQNFLESVTFFLSGADNITLEDLFTRIGVELPDASVLNPLGLSATTRITPCTRKSVGQFLVAMRHKILQVARETRRGLYHHLLELGLTDGMRVAFVDVGWSGTTQKAFERALEGMFELDVQGYYLGLSEPAASLSQKTGLRLKAMSETLRLDDRNRALLYDNRAVAELFFSAPYGTTIGYRQDAEGHLFFVEDCERGIDYDIGLLVESINQGISDYVADAEQLLRTLALPIERYLPMHNLLQLLGRPSAEQAALIGRIYNWDAWASSEGYRIYFAARPEESTSHCKPDLWPAGWQVVRSLPPEALLRVGCLSAPQDNQPVPVVEAAAVRRAVEVSAQ